MKDERAREIQMLLGISRPVESDAELSQLGVKGQKYGIEFWEVCEAVRQVAEQRRTGREKR